MSVSHLSVHSHYSLLNGLPQIGALVNQAAKYAMPSLALTDRNNLYGAIEFYKACEKKKIKPIIGVDLDIELADRARIILLAENNAGYQNLLELVSGAHVEHKGDPHANEQQLEKNKDGLIVLIPEETLQGGGNTLVQTVMRIYGSENVFARIGWNTKREEKERLIQRAREYGLRLVAGEDVYYIEPEDKEARDIVRRIGDPDATADTANRSFVTEKVFKEYYREYPDAIQNLEAVVARISVVLSLGSWILPHYAIPENTSYESELEKVAREGFALREMEVTKEAEDRLRYELTIIANKGYTSYFLAVADLLKFARDNGILTTTRGSAAGSLVSYLTGITNIDPIEYKLPFERFLNPERPKAPDIDMDIADEHRDAMIRYARKKYGSDNVAQIGTFGTMMARAAVRDIARSLGYAYGVGDRIAKLIPIGSQGFPMTIERALEIEEDLRRLYQSDEDVENIINTAKQVEGNARHISVHAAGVVIAPSKVTDFAPVQWDPHNEQIITQYDMYSITDEYGGVGLLKFDFLGLTVLSILGDAVRRVKDRKGIAIDINDIALDDTEVFTMLSRGETEGLFQLGGGGMTRYLKELEPTSIHDINAMVALYRPGPMESIPEYIARKKNPKLITYLDPRMEKILDRSYGIITYQDDVLMIAIEIAGYSWLEADNLRKAMGKKIPIEMEAQKEKFIDGCVDNGKISVGKAQAIWKLIEPFAAYGFNKAHAASYGKVAYQTAYMKTHHTADYMASLMTADAGNVDKIAVHVGECVRLGIHVLPPDINESFATFTVVNDTTIRFGLNSIKNFGGVSANAVMEERAKNGPYPSIGDLAIRTSGGMLHRRGLETLIKAGALDTFGDRKNMLGHVDTILDAQIKKNGASENQGALFALEAKAPDIPIQREDTTPLSEKLAWEKELLGIYVSGHPVDQHEGALSKYRNSIQSALEEDRKGFPVVIGGVVDTGKTILTKKGERMGFYTIADRSHSIEAVAFPKIFKEAKDALTEGACVLIKGKLSHRNETPSILIDKVKKL